MISVEEATRIILENTAAFGEETVPLRLAAGRVLREDLLADRDFPPFDRVAMDGVALRSEAFGRGQRVFPVEGLQAAGAPQLVLKNEKNCLEVMTGAVLPKNADAVVRCEDVEMQDGQARILLEKVSPGQNLHPQAADRRRGETVVRAGCQISPAEIAVAATVGKAALRVAKLPRVAVLSTGDELVEVEETPLPHQIRKSNAHALAAALARWGVGSELLHLLDDRADIEATLRGCLKKFDALLLSGGVSEGKLDFVPQVMADLGVKRLFHKVSQRPGKPFWFGKACPENSGAAGGSPLQGAGAAGAVVFAFPGNPVSTFLCLHRYFQPWLRASLGMQPFDFQHAVLEEDFFFKPALTCFLQVKTSRREDGLLTARPAAGGGSGDLANLADADAFLELPLEREVFIKGEAYPLTSYR